MALDISPRLLKSDLGLFPHRLTPLSDDQEKKAVFYSALRGTGYGELARVQLSLDDVQVELSGEVSSYFLKQLAQETIRPLAIGLRIVNHLHVTQNLAHRASARGPFQVNDGQSPNIP
jgi:hypothetical protein